MAALTSQQVMRVWSDGPSDRAALYALRKVTTADTFDASADFLIVKQAVALGTTVSGIAACVVSGTTITMPAGLVSDAGYLLVWGPSA